MSHQIVVRYSQHVQSVRILSVKSFMAQTAPDANMLIDHVFEEHSVQHTVLLAIILTAFQYSWKGARSGVKGSSGLSPA